MQPGSVADEGVGFDKKQVLDARIYLEITITDGVGDVAHLGVVVAAHVLVLPLHRQVGIVVTQVGGLREVVAFAIRTKRFEDHRLPCPTIVDG